MLDVLHNQLSSIFASAFANNHFYRTIICCSSFPSPAFSDSQIIFLAAFEISDSPFCAILSTLSLFLALPSFSPLLIFPSLMSFMLFVLLRFPFGH